MLISVFIAQGFEHQIRTKVIGFGSHIQVLPFLNEAETGSESMKIDQPFYKDYQQYEAIKSIQPVGYKPGIIQRVKKNEKGNREIEGVLFKGINRNYDKDFLKQHLQSGRTIRFPIDGSGSKEIMISTKMANLLDIGVGDTVASVLISKGSENEVKPAIRKLVICGIYETGLEEFDKEYVFIDLFHIQKANGWGINLIPDINDTLKNNSIEVKLNVITDAQKFYLGLNGKPYPYSSIFLPLTSGTYVFQTSENKNLKNGDEVTIKVVTTPIQISNDHQYGKLFSANGKYFTVIVTTSKGTSHEYAGSFEINLKSWEDLYETDAWLYKFIGPGFTTRTIVEQQSHIFNWLTMVDMNVTIIVGLMLLVAIINLISAILVLILERSKMIGLLKAFGAENGSIGKLFFYFTGNILVRGLIIGNIIAIGFYFLQVSTGFISLNPETYFVNSVPLQFDVYGYLFVNVLTIVVGLVSYLLPVILVNKINPAKAIKIE